MSAVSTPNHSGLQLYYLCRVVMLEVFSLILLLNFAKETS